MGGGSELGGGCSGCGGVAVPPRSAVAAGRRPLGASGGCRSGFGRGRCRVRSTVRPLPAPERTPRRPPAGRSSMRLGWPRRAAGGGGGCGGLAVCGRRDGSGLPHGDGDARRGDDGARCHALAQSGQAAQRPITVARTALRHSEDSATARLNDVVQSPSTPIVPQWRGTFYQGNVKDREFRVTPNASERDKIVRRWVHHGHVVDGRAVAAGRRAARRSRRTDRSER